MHQFVTNLREITFYTKRESKMLSLFCFGLMLQNTDNNDILNPNEKEGNYEFGSFGACWRYAGI